MLVWRKRSRLGGLPGADTVSSTWVQVAKLKGTSINVISVIASEARQSSALIKQAFLDRHVASLLATTIYRSALN
jgi:hypothetical protein